MTIDDLARWAADFEAFCARFARFFSRSEPRLQALNYLRGLLSSVQRKNSWQMAEAVGEPDPASMQYLLYGAVWEADAVGAELQRFVVERFGHPAGIAVLDESAFVKKGNFSVGVKRQWCSTLGKKENCQVGVFLTYVSPHGHTFLDRRLYLPQEWCDDQPRRRKAGVPDTVDFATKPQLAQKMLEQAWERGVPMRWVTGDECYGNQTALRDAIHAHGLDHGLAYVLAISASTHVWRERPALEFPAAKTGGRPRKHARLAPEAPASETVAAVVASWPEASWQRRAVGQGEKGPRLYDWAGARVIEYRDGLPREELWLLSRRSLSPPYELAYYFADAPEDTALATLVEVAGARWTIEQCLEESKGETGLDEYEVRYWCSWHRHITLSMMAHAWLASVRSRERRAEAGEKDPSAAGRTHRSRSATPAGSGAAIGATVVRPKAGLVAVPPADAPARPPRPLPSPGRGLVTG